MAMFLEQANDRQENSLAGSQNPSSVCVIPCKRQEIYDCDQKTAQSSIFNPCVIVLTKFFLNKSQLFVVYIRIPCVRWKHFLSSVNKKNSCSKLL